MDKDLKNKTLNEIEQIVEGHKQPKYLGKYIFSFIHQKGAADIDSITTLSKALRQQLKEDGYFVSNLKIAKKAADTDGTVKYLFELADGSSIESVLLFDDERATLCASTQVGCAMACLFCATGKMGFSRNLSAAEIADQINAVEKDAGERIDNVVFMGMGEPLLNYENVLRAVRILNDAAGKNIGARKMTISTCGIAEGIERLAGEGLQVRLAVSLNAADDKLRSSLMGISRKYPLSRLMRALVNYQRKTGRRVTFEYVMIKDVNDRIEDAKRLIFIIRNIKCNVNLIQLNPHTSTDLKPSNKEQVKKFAQILKDSGIETVIRLSKGTHIQAACGQLKGEELRVKGEGG